MNKPLGSKIFILSPLVKNEKGTHKDTLEKFHGRGYERFRVDGEIKRYSEIGALEKIKNILSM